jgi:pentatricopeptide repeat protein
MLWRVGRGSRQSHHHIVHFLTDLFIPSSPRTSHPYRSLPLTCLRAFALSRRRVRPVPVPCDCDDPNTSDSPPKNPSQLTEHRSVPPANFPLGRPASIGHSHLCSTAVPRLGKEDMKILADPDVLRALSDSRKVSRLAQQMISTPHPLKALRILVVAHHYGCHLGREVYEAVARRLAEAREWKLIPALALLQKRQLGRHTTRLLDWYIRALIEMAQFARLDRAFGLFIEEGLTPSRRTYHLLLYGHLRNRHIGKAMDVIQQMLKAGFTIDTCTQATVVSAYRTLGPDVVVQTRALNALKDADAKTATRVLNALLRFSMDTRDAERVISLIRHFDFGTFDVSRLSVGVYPLRCGEDATLSDLIRSSSLSHGSHLILPDIATYTMLLRYLATQGDLASAHDLLQQMERSGITPDSRFIAALIRFYFIIGKPSAAMDVVSTICADVEDFQIVFEGLHLASESQGWSPLPCVLPRPTIEILNALAAGLLHTHGIDGLQACLRLMETCQVNPDHHTKTLLETHLINAEGFTVADIANGFSLNNPSRSNLSQFLASSFHHHLRSVKRSGWNNTPPGKRNLFQTRSPSISAVGKSFDPTAGIHSALTSQIARIRPTTQSLIDRGVLADHRMFALRIRCEAVIKGDMKAAEKVFQMMLDRGLHPNEFHYAALMEGYAAIGEMTAAEAVMNAAERGGTRPNCVMHTILIVGYARRKNPERAMRVLRHMVATGVRPDVPVIDAITSVFFAVGAYRLARQTLLSLWPSVAPLPYDFERVSLKMLVFHLRNLHNGHISSKKLSERERRELISKLKESSKTWFSTEKSRTDSQRETLMYVKGHGTLRRESSQSHPS